MGYPPFRTVVNLSLSLVVVSGFVAPVLLAQQEGAPYGVRSTLCNEPLRQSARLPRTIFCLNEDHTAGGNSET